MSERTPPGPGIYQLLLLIGSSIGISIGAAAWIVHQHEKQPKHTDAVSKVEYNQFLKNTDEWRRDIKYDLRELKRLMLEVLNDKRRTEKQNSVFTK